MSDYGVIYANGHILTGLTRQSAFHIYNSHRENKNHRRKENKTITDFESQDIAILKFDENSWKPITKDFELEWGNNE